MQDNRLKLEYFFDKIDDFILPEVFNNIDYPWQALKSAKELLDNYISTKEPIIKSNISENVHIKGWVMIGENTTIDPNVVIGGPVVIGDNCKIKSNALIRPGSVISNNCSIGHGSEVKNSLVFSGAKIASLTFVGDSIIGIGGRVGSGTITTNRRFDQNEIGIKFENEFYEFGTDFFGCILGDYSRLGANCTTLPGTVIGQYSWVLPLTRVGRFVPSKKIVGYEQELIMKENKVVKLKN